MTATLMRRAIPPQRVRAQLLQCRRIASPAFATSHRRLASVREREFFPPELWFTSSSPYLWPVEGFGNDHKPPDQRTIKLGRTIRTIHERLPTLLASPLPQDILSPQITLQLFPSTHPHLPTVSGKLAYSAALWTAPVAWGRFPVLGNNKLVILSERMFSNGGSSVAANMRNEKLIVKWKTCGKKKNGNNGNHASDAHNSQLSTISEILGGGDGQPRDKEFCGLFMFEFDEEGRLLTHTIEHAEEGGNWDKMSRFISVTDWLLGRAWGKRDELPPGLALGYCEHERRLLRGRRQRDDHRD